MVWKIVFNAVLTSEQLRYISRKALHYVTGKWETNSVYSIPMRLRVRRWRYWTIFQLLDLFHINKKQSRKYSKMPWNKTATILVCWLRETGGENGEQTRQYLRDSDCVAGESERRFDEKSERELRDVRNARAKNVAHSVDRALHASDASDKAIAPMAYVPGDQKNNTKQTSKEWWKTEYTKKKKLKHVDLHKFQDVVDLALYTTEVSDKAIATMGRKYRKQTWKRRRGNKEIQSSRAHELRHIRNASSFWYAFLNLGCPFPHGL